MKIFRPPSSTNFFFILKKFNINKDFVIYYVYQLLFFFDEISTCLKVLKAGSRQ